MSTYLVRRLGQSLITVAMVVVLVFILTRVVGNPVDILLPIEASREQRELLAHQLGLDKPLLVQLAEFWWNTVRGDLGLSWWQRVPVLDLILERIPLTLKLIGLAFAIAVVISLPLALLAAYRPGSLLERGIVSLATVGLCMPNFWVGLMLIFLFGVKLRWLPTTGGEDLKGLIMPAFSLSLLPIGRFVNILRSALLEERRKQYVTTALAKGLTEYQVMLAHMLRNASVPLVTMVGWELARMFAGYTVAVETVFSLPGIGDLVVKAIRNQDFPLLQGLTFFVALVICLCNLLVDITYAMLDPRIRLE